MSYSNVPILRIIVRFYKNIKIDVILDLIYIITWDFFTNYKMLIH